MADLIKKLKIKKQDGTFTDYIPIGADAINVATNDGESVQLKLNKKPYYYMNVANMKADIKLTVGDMAITLGYYAANDGGGAEYQIVNDNTLIDDGGSIHDLNNGLKAKLIIKDNIINIKQFGALQNEDSGSIIQKIIDLKKTVFVPKGTWLCSPITLISGSKIIGENVNYQINNTANEVNSSLSILQCNQDCETFIDCTNACYLDISICLASCRTKGAWQNAKSIDQFVKLDKTHYSTFDLMILCLNNYGISIKNSWENTFKRLYFRGILAPNVIDIKCLEGENGISQTIFYDIQSEGFGATILDVSDNCLYYHNTIKSILTELSPYEPFEISSSTATQLIPLFKIGSGGDNIIDSILINNSHLKGSYNNVVYYHNLFSIDNPYRAFGFLINSIMFDGNMTTGMTFLKQTGNCISSADYLIINKVIAPSAPIFNNDLESMGYFQIKEIYSRNLDVRNFGQNSITNWYKPQNCSHMPLYRKDDNRNELNNERAVCKIKTNTSEAISSLAVKKGDKIKILYKSDVPINYSVELWQRNRTTATTLTGTLGTQNYYTLTDLVEITNTGRFIARINLQAEQTQSNELGNSFIADIFI